MIVTLNHFEAPVNGSISIYLLRKAAEMSCEKREMNVVKKKFLFVVVIGLFVKIDMASGILRNSMRPAHTSFNAQLCVPKPKSRCEKKNTTITTTMIIERSSEISA